MKRTLLKIYSSFTLTSKTKSSQGVWIIPLTVKRLLEKNLNHFLLVSLIVLFTHQVSATNYYVSSSGNDSNAGTSESLPWRTLTKVNSFTPKPGDQILFKRGEEWNGTITVRASGANGSPIVYGAYGTGNKPKIYGSEVITSWTLHTGNIYKATFNTDIKQLFINDERATLARYPNSGYFNITSVQTTSQFTSTSLSGAINYKGASWIGRTSAFTMYSRIITTSSSQTLTLNSAPSYSLGTGEGFFLADKLEFLDQAGEWYYDTSTNTVYLWTPNGSTPANYEVRGSTLDYGIRISNKSFITIENLEVAQSATAGVLVVNSDYITIHDNTISKPDLRGIDVDNASSYIVMDGNYIYEANSNGIYCKSTRCTFTNNIIEDIGLLENINKTTYTSDNFGTAIFSRSDYPIISYNRIINAGYCGINWKGINGYISHNYINGACQVLDDGGGIYTYNGADADYGLPGAAGSVVKNNIVLNVYGNPDGYTKGYYLGYGIYMDNSTHDVTITDNTIKGATCGVLYNYSGKILFDGNTVMDATLLLHVYQEAENSTFTNNIFYTTDRLGTFKWWGTNSTQKIVYQEAGASAIYDYNIYISHYEANDVFVNMDSFATWKTKTKQDLNSTFDGSPFSSGETEELFYNDTKETKKFNLENSVYLDIYGKQISESLTLQPFTSKILIKTKSAINPDTSRPIISSFIVPSTSSSINVQVSSFNSTDNIGVTGFKITETITSPKAEDSGWNEVVPTSYNCSGAGSKTLYAWTKDAAGNVSSSLSDQVMITLPTITDVTKPNVTNFSIPATSSSLVLPVSSFTASDNKSVTGFKITETSVTPNAGDAGWSNVAPTSYSFSSEGNKTLYAWSKDEAGNVSASVSKQVVITLPISLGNMEVYSLITTSANLRAIPVTFSESAEINSISIYHNGGTGNLLLGVYSDQSGSPSSLLAETVSTIINKTEGWQTESLVIPIIVTSGQTVWLSWVFENNPGIRYKIGTPTRAQSSETWAQVMPATFGISSFADYNYSIFCSFKPIEEIIIPDNTKPTITNFSIPATSSSLVLPVSSFTASDNKSVTGFKITETSVTPNAKDAGWSTVAPTSYSFSSEGNKTLYAWSKDEAGNVSASVSKQVVITLPDVAKPAVTAFTIPVTSSSLVVTVNSFTATDNIAVTGFKLTETTTAPNAGDAGWSTGAPTSYSFTTEGTKTLYAWARDAAGNVSSSVSAQVVISLPDVAKPAVTDFTIPVTSSSLVVTVNSFTATDNIAVTGFKLTETTTAPNAGDAGWSTGAPTSYSFTTEGTKTLYAWARDAAGNVSSSVSAQVVISLPIENPLPDVIITEIPVNTQFIELKKGWNIFSTYLTPTNEGIDSVMEALRFEGKLITVQDERDNTYQDASLKSSGTDWINNIGKLQKPEGYKIRVASSCNLEITGKPVQLPLNIEIHEGWNIISFPINGTMDAMQVVQPLIDAGILYKIQDEKGFSIEEWSKGWRNNVGNFNAGEGYILQANKSGVLTINNTEVKSGFLVAERLEPNYFKVCYDGNGLDHMNINIVELNETSLQVGDEIAVYDGKICVGAIKLTEMDFINNAISIPVSASEPNVTNGFTEGNPIKLKVWKNETNQESELLTEVIEGNMIFDKQASVFALLKSQSTNVTDVFNNLKIDLYPNPASTNITVRFSVLPEGGTKISIINAIGKEVLSRVAENTNETLNIQDLPSGMYLVKTQLNNNYQIQKLIKR